MNNFELLKSHEAYVSKIGGDNAGEISKNIENLLKSDLKVDKKNILVFSAIRNSDKKYKSWAHERTHEKEGFNTTSHLIEFSKSLARADFETANNILDRLANFLLEIIRSEFQTSLSLRAQASEIINKEIQILKGYMDFFKNPEITTSIQNIGDDFLAMIGNEVMSVTGWGENLSQKIYANLLNEENVGELELSNYSQLSNFEISDIDQPKILAKHKQDITNNMRSQLSTLLPEKKIILAGGYIPILAMSRGYSDKIGAMIAAEAKDLGVDAAYLIEKSFSIKSIDPRKLENASLAQHIEYLGYPFAKELFGARNANAGAVHSEALGPLSNNDVSAYVLNLEELDNITRIGGDEMVLQEPMIENISARKCQSILTITSDAMNEVGIGKILGDWFSEKNISFDHSSTSETAISYTFQDGMGAASAKELENYLAKNYADKNFQVSNKGDQSLVFFLGNNVSDIQSYSQIFDSLATVGVTPEFVSAGANRQSIVLSVPDESVEKVLNMAHEKCIETTSKLALSI